MKRKRVYIGRGKLLFLWEDEFKGEESEGGIEAANPSSGRRIF